MTSLLTALDLFCPASSSLSVISLSDPSLSVTSVSHPLKIILCRLEREHLMQQLGFIHSLGNGLPLYALSCERVCHPDSDTGNLVTEPLSSNGWQLRFKYSGFQRYATIYIYILNAIFRQHTLLISRSIALYSYQYHFTKAIIIFINSTLCFVLSFCSSDSEAMFGITSWISMCLFS
jgi:hypothetical protein